MGILTATRTLILLAITSLALMLTMTGLDHYAGGTLLDTVISPGESQRLLASMSPEQKSAHLWITATLDSAFPVLYGLLLIGLTLRVFETVSTRIVPACSLVAVDFLENAVQMLVLTGLDSLLVFKGILTPAKFVLLLIAVGIIVIRVLQTRRIS